MHFSWWQAFTVLVLHPALPFAVIVFGVIAVCMTAYLRSVKITSTPLARICKGLTVLSWGLCIVSAVGLLALPPKQNYTNEQMDEMSRMLFIPVVDTLNNLNGTPSAEKTQL